MQNYNSLKKEILKKWINGLQICSSLKENMPLLQRKKAIKLSADLAMASTTINSKRSNYNWSRALINKASKDSETANFAKKILQGNLFSNVTFLSKSKTRTIRVNQCINKRTKTTSRKMYKYGPRNSCGVSKNRSLNYKVKARSIAKRLVKKRTQILKGLIPGGESLDEYSLVKETLDYIVSLKAQVDVMQHLANSPQLLIDNYLDCHDM